MFLLEKILDIKTIHWGMSLHSMQPQLHEADWIDIDH